jgi:phospholipase/carboxylesterase
MILIDGPRIPPKSGTAKKLVILFHGYGSNGADLAGLAQAWAPNFPDIAWASPDAPEPVPGAPGGYQWFPISRLDPEAMESGVRSAYPTAEQFIKSELNRWALTPADLVLVGFSQGTMMALHTGLRREIAPAGILGFSGALPGPERLKSEIACKPPILLIHGDRDDVLPVGMTLMAAQGLAEAGHGAEFHISQGIPHSIGPDGLELGGRFIQNAFAGKLK